MPGAVVIPHGLRGPGIVHADESHCLGEKAYTDRGVGKPKPDMRRTVRNVVLVELEFKVDRFARKRDSGRDTPRVGRTSVRAIQKIGRANCGRRLEVRYYRRVNGIGIPVSDLRRVGVGAHGVFVKIVRKEDHAQGLAADGADDCDGQDCTKYSSHC